MLGKQLFLPLCRPIDYFLGNISKLKMLSTYRLGQIISFNQKQRQIIFFRKSSSPPPQIMKWSLSKCY